MKPPISFPEALAAVLADVEPMPAEWVDAGEVEGRVLAAPLLANCDLPRFDCSAVDGYGIRAEDGQPGRWVDVVSSIAAGDTFTDRSLAEGQTVRIFTGSRVPPGVEAIVMQEDVERIGDAVRILGAVEAGASIRRRGGEVREGAELLPAGMRANPAVCSLIATLGMTKVQATGRPTVAIVATGSELKTPGEPLGASGIYEAITPGLTAAIGRCGANVTSCELVKDDFAATRAALDAALGADIVITCGGVSVGDHDLVRGALESLKVEEVVWRVAIRPGKPFFYGRGPEGQRVFGLPGNPVSALVTFQLFVRPVLCQMAALPAPKTQKVTLGHPWPQIGDRDDFLRVKLIDGAAWIGERQESHMLSGLAEAFGLVRLPAFSGPYSGQEKVELHPLDW